MSDFQHELVGKSYEIRLKGHLDKSWADWFEGFTFTHEKDGITIISGDNIDQAALHGILKRIRDLGLPLISVNRLNTGNINEEKHYE